MSGEKNKDGLLTVTDNEFDGFIEGAPAPVLVQFHAAWCQPCKALTKIVAAMAKEFGDQLVVAQFDVDEGRIIPKKYNVRGIPTMILFKENKVVEHVQGLVGKDRLRASLQKHLGA